MSGNRPTRYLWIARHMPYPALEGASLYTAGLSTSLAKSGAEVTMIGHEEPGKHRGTDDRIVYHGVSGGTFNEKRIAALSPLPVNTGIQATAAYTKSLRQLLENEFDVIVIDSLSSGWVLDLVQRFAPTTPTVYLAHNNETSVWATMKNGATGSPVRRVTVRRNADKVARLEQRLVNETTLVCAITENDAELFSAAGATRQPLIISPGYSGGRTESRSISPDTPRRVVMVGSYKWAPKEENLRQFLKVADPAFAAANIYLDVIGSIPEHVRSSVSDSLVATTLHGFVEDPRTILSNARLAAMPELIGGGFKLKTLDYFFNRLPIVSIASAVEGAPVELRNMMYLTDDLTSLTAKIVNTIDEHTELDRRQSKSYDLAQDHFNWDDRGPQLDRAAIALRTSPV